MTEKVREFILKRKVLAFLPSANSLTKGEERELRELISDFSQDKKLKRLLELYSLASSVNIEGNKSFDASYELGSRDAIVNLRNLLTIIQREGVDD